MQTSLKRWGLKFSSRYDMSAKFPRGGSRTFFSSKSITFNRPKAFVTMYFVFHVSVSVETIFEKIT